MYTTTRILPTVMSISHTKLLLLIVTIFVLKTFNHHAEASTYLNTLDDLQHFYKTSYISKETGHFQFKPEKNKIYFADGYDPNWGVYRFHHVCLRGGRDGLYSGTLYNMICPCPIDKTNIKHTSFSYWLEFTPFFCGFFILFLLLLNSFIIRHIPCPLTT